MPKTTEEIIDEWRYIVDYLKKSRECKRKWYSEDEVKELFDRVELEVEMKSSEWNKYLDIKSDFLGNGDEEA